MLSEVKVKLISVNQVLISVIETYVCSMQTKIVFILIMMTCCVFGITTLQLYWNYKNYQTVVANYKKDANNALEIAVDKEISKRRNLLVLKVKTWLADTSIVKITCDTNNKENTTAFTITDAVPYYKDEKADQTTLGIASFKQKLNKITPKAKQIFINHFAERINGDLKDGTTFYYTQGLGHRIEAEFEKSVFSKNDLISFFKSELSRRKISSEFIINPTKIIVKDGFLTNKINTAFRRPYDKNFVQAQLANPNQYYFQEMKWLIISSFLLIVITLCCFYYTIKTLLNQYKLITIKNQFISNMTHEINTPLSSIQVTAEALQHFDSDQKTRKSYLDIILFQTKKLSDLSNEILANAKLETTTIKIDEHINLNDLILEIIENQYFNKDNNIIYEPTINNLTIKGNKKHLSRSIVNVIDNALKYNTAEIPIVQLSLQQHKNEISINIIDNGPGIADDFKTKIFDQFYRIPTGNIHNIKGYGLGLSYVKRVVNQHFGTVKVFDNKPNGSIFKITLPYAK